jgi:hypothetical protein
MTIAKIQTLHSKHFPDVWPQQKRRQRKQAPDHEYVLHIKICTFEILPTFPLATIVLDISLTLTGFKVMDFEAEDFKAEDI